MSEDAEADDYLEESQFLTHYRFEGALYPRLPYGLETFRDPVEAGCKPCRHCGAVKDQLHEPLCDYEQCPVCGDQVMSCDCGIFTEAAVAADPLDGLNRMNKGSDSGRVAGDDGAS